MRNLICSMWDLVCQPEIKPGSYVLGAWSLSPGGPPYYYYFQNFWQRHLFREKKNTKLILHIIMPLGLSMLLAYSLIPRMTFLVNKTTKEKNFVAAVVLIFGL